jgi:arylsulfatase A-like enzyme
MRWPDQIPARRTESQVGIMMDLTATILAATKTPVPAEARLEGIDLIPIVTGRSPRIERTLFFRITQTRQQRAVRQGDWKLLLDAGDTLLFNLREDVGERTDLAKERSDIARRLRPLLTEWEKDVDSEAKATAATK